MARISASMLLRTQASDTLPGSKVSYSDFFHWSQYRLGALACTIFSASGQSAGWQQFHILFDYWHHYRIYSHSDLHADRQCSALYAISQLAEYHCDDNTA